MTELTFTQLVTDEIHALNIEKMASEANVVEIGSKIALLSSYMARITQEVASRQSAYNRRLNEELKRLDGKSVASAKVEAEASKEYVDLLQAKALRESTVEAIRGLKYLAKALVDEEKYGN
jgi:hypothetical protein